MMVLRHWFKQCRLALLVFLLILPAALVYASPNIMTVDEIKPGMIGIGKTVVSGTTPEDFGVKVLGIMKNAGPSGDLILIRTYGKVIDRTGGIAEGMSGSPVYIDGKLIGAVAYGWSMADHKIGMVTPIADMLKLFNLPDEHNQWGDSNALKGLKPLATPVMVSGFSENAMNMLKEKLKPFNMMPYAIGSVSDGTPYGYGSLQPGGSVGVALMRGDVSMGAIGTVTYMDGDKVLAFGHPFLQKGNVGYFMTNAYIYTTVNSLDSSFKLGTIGDALGTINQDRGAGVAGRLNYYPSVIPLRISVTDNDTGKKKESDVQVVDDQQLSPILSATAMFNALDKTIDRVGAGTANVSFEIMGRNLPGGVLKRENMFYSPANISQEATSEFLEAMAMLESNPYKSADIMDVKINVNVSEDQRTAEILEAHVKNTNVKPGDKVDIAVKLKPYRGEPFVRTIAYTVPKEQAAGPLTLEVRGGGVLPLTALLLKQQGAGDLLALNQLKNKEQSLSDEVKDFVGRDHNNDIVVEVMNIPVLGAVAPGKTPNSQKAADNVQTVKNPLQAVKQTESQNNVTNAGGKSSVSTDYIIGGDTQVVLNVSKGKS
jgi:hypothetical protein